MKRKTLGMTLVWTAGVLMIAGCTPSNSSPEAIRHDTAQATATVARDAKAVALGLADGLRHHAGPLNVNTASSTELQGLPGMQAEEADRIVANRPYKTTQELVRRKMVTQAEYRQIADKIVAQ